jgi:hypothetical protein
MDEKRKELLIKDINEIAPTLETITEEYFGEEFIKKYLKKYDIKKRPHIAELLLYPGDSQFTINLNSGVYKNFNENKISGYGISSLVHELSHIYQYHLFKRLDNLNWYLKEAHANLSMYEILINSKNPKLESAIKDAIFWHNQDLNNEDNAYRLAYNSFNNQKDMEKRKILLGQTELFERYVSLVA